MPPIYRPLSRRTLLRGAGGAAIALPLLEAMLPRRASAQGLKQRFITMVSPNGTIPANWFPTGTENDWQLTPILEPFAPHKNDLIVFRGIDNKVCTGRRFAGHFE